MKKECDIVKDLLPLYEEDMLSEASNEYVEKHLRECEECLGYEGKNLVKVNKEDGGVKEIKGITSKIKKHYLNIGLLVLMIIAISATIIIGTLSTPSYFSANSKVINVVEKDGQIVVQFSPEVTGYDLSSSKKEDSSMYNYTIGVYYSKFDQLMNKGNLDPIVLNSNDERVYFVYQYSPYDKEDAVIYGNKTMFDGGKKTLQRLAHKLFLGLVIGLWTIILLFIIGLLLIKKAKRLLNALAYLFALISTYIMIHIAYFSSGAPAYLLVDPALTIGSLTIILYIVELAIYKLFLRINRA